MKRRLFEILACVLFVTLLIQISLYTYDFEQDRRNSGEVSVQEPVSYGILIDIEDYRLYLLNDGICVKSYPIAVGKADTPSPIGYWKIISKSDWGEGFGGRWMGLNVIWGQYGIHGTLSPNSIGHAASHGCIRMFSRDVREVYRVVPRGTPVMIVGGCYGPFGRGFRTLLPGDRGADVLAVQSRLKQLGYYSGTLNGIYNDAMKYALHNFQKANKVHVHDGIGRQDYNLMGLYEMD